MWSHFLLTSSGVPFSPAHPTPPSLTSSIKEEGQKILSPFTVTWHKPQVLNSKWRTFAGLPELKDNSFVLIWLLRMPPASQHSRASSRLTFVTHCVYNVMWALSLMCCSDPPCLPSLSICSGVPVQPMPLQVSAACKWLLIIYRVFLSFSHSQITNKSHGQKKKRRKTTVL